MFCNVYVVPNTPEAVPKPRRDHFGKEWCSPLNQSIDSATVL